MVKEKRTKLKSLTKKEAMIHSFYSEFAVLEEESDLWASHGFVSVTHSQPSQTLKFTHTLNSER